MDEQVALEFAADVESAVASVRELADSATGLADAAKGAADGVASLAEPATAAGDAIKGVADSATSADGALAGNATAAKDAATSYTGLADAAREAAGAQGEAAGAARTASDAQEGAAAKNDAAGASAAGMGSKVATAGLAAAVGIGAAVDGAVKFQAETTRLVTSAGESANQLGKVQQGMLALSGQTDQSTSELANGMYTVESAGFHGAQGLTVLKAAAQGAKDEGADVATVANGLTDALVDFHKPASDAANVTSQLIAGVSHGKTTFEQFAGSMSTVLPLASSLHLKFADVVGMEAEMTSHGISAQEASQQMANAMRELMKPNAAMVKEFGLMGISADQVYNKLGTSGLSGTMEWLSGVAHKGAAAVGQNYNEALAKLTGSANGLQVALATTGENTAGTTSAIKAVSDATADAKGNVDGFGKVSQTAAFKLGAAKDSAEAAGISLGMALLPAVTAVLGPITSFLQMISSNKTAADAFALVIGTVLATAIGGKLVGAVKDVKGAVEGVGKGIGWVVGKFKDIGTAGQDAAKTAETAQKAAAKATETAADAAATTQEADAAKGAAANVKAAEESADKYAWMARKQEAAADEAATTSEADAAEVAAANDEAAVESSGSWVTAAARQLVAAATWVAQSVAKVAVVVASNVAGAASTLAAWVATGAGMVLQGVLWVAGTVAKVAVVVGANIAGAAVTAAAWVVANGIMLLGIGLVVAAVVIAVVEIVKHWNTIVHGVEVVWNTIWNFVSKIVGDIVNFVKSHWQLLVAILGGPIAVAVVLITKYWGDIQHGAETAVNAVITFFKNLPGNIVRVVGDLGRLLLNAGEDIITGLLHGIESAVGGLLSTVQGIGHDISSAFSSVLGIFSPSRVFYEHGRNTLQGYIDGIKAAAPGVHAALAGVGGSIAGAGSTLAAGAVAPAGGSTGGSATVNITANIAPGMEAYQSPQFLQYMQQQMQEATLRYGQLNSNNGLTPQWGH